MSPLWRLTPGQRAVVKALRVLKRQGRPTPALEEIRQLTGFTSRTSVWNELQRLVVLGIVEQNDSGHYGLAVRYR